MNVAFETLKKYYLHQVCSLEVWKETMWNGVPFQQIPEDIVALSEAVYQSQPDAVVEVGVYAGGGLEFYATLLSRNPKGLVVGVELNILDKVRVVTDRHPGRVKIVGGDSASPKTIETVRGLVGDRRTLVVLDSYHEAAHVAKELELYAPLVSPGSYMVVMDGIIKDLVGVLRIPSDAATNNPESAVKEFLTRHLEFQRDHTKNRFGPSLAPGGFLKRIILA
jgi:cephalosporin hydroxylase